MTWSNTKGSSSGLIPGRNTLGPLFLIVVSPIFLIGILHRTIYQLDGSLVALWEQIQDEGFVTSLYNGWPTYQNPYVWKLIGYFMAFELLILKLVPGQTYRGPVTPAGNVPVYNANGIQAYLITIATFLLGWYMGIYKGGVLYDYHGQILSSMNVFGLLFCLFLYVKGRLFPSSSDYGTTGNPIFDYYWGTELYPRIFGWDVKQFTNCRCGMMFWALFIISCMLKQLDGQGFVSNPLLVNGGIQLIYITKFYIWESGYFSTMDIMHDRAGFYICWGCLVFLPMIYVSHTAYIVEHSADWSNQFAAAIFIAGAVSVYINYDSDRQRQNFRAKDGKVKVWGKPAEYIVAKYETERGQHKTSLLLTNGYWGISRHFHYIPEIMASVFWTLPVWCSAWLPWFYIPYLIILLTDRAFRDDARCQSKYGKYWHQYCQKVPYKMVPGLL